jgi:hypothetical protein
MSDYELEREKDKPDYELMKNIRKEIEILNFRLQK